jgi:hypothetical protein
MAQRDLDAALQLLADRAQYITGAGGAAIALRRNGKNDMLCRARTGSNAPELGALLSTELGLSGESVRTRRPLRCDNAEHDARVNREVCRRMGIASVAVMPVVHDDEVLGVFELFSGQANAFGERDLSALRRLSEMVETAVELARAAEMLPAQLKTAEPAAEVALAAVSKVPETLVEPAAERHLEPLREPVLEEETKFPSALQAAVPAPTVAAPLTAPPQHAPLPAKPAVLKRPLFWSAPLNESGEAEKAAEPDQSHVPPVLRNLRKCEACGFPVSAGRALCVECEEKRWRGQLRMPQAALKPPSDPAKVPAPAAQAFAAAAQSGALAVPVAVQQRTPAVRPEPVVTPLASESAAEKAEEPAQAAPQEVTFGAGLEPSQSWFAANKYILGALLVVAATVAALVLLR